MSKTLTFKQVTDERAARNRTDNEKAEKAMNDATCSHPRVGQRIRNGKTEFYCYLNGYDKAPVVAKRWQTLVAKLEA